MPRKDPRAVRELHQPPQAVEEPFGARRRLHGEIGACDRTDKERIAREDGVVDQEAAVLGPMPRRVDDAHPQRPALDLSAVHERLVRKRGIGGRMQADLHALFECEPPVPGDVVGVRVRLEDAGDLDLVLLCRLEVGLDCVCRVDEDRLVRLFVPDQVGGAAEIVVDELAKEHRGGR